MRTRSMPYSLQKTTPPSALPLSVSEVKSALQITDTDSDDELSLILRASTEAIEQYLRRTLVNTTWTIFYDRFPGKELPWWDGIRQLADTELTDLTEPIVLPMPPVVSVTHVKAHLTTGEVTVSASDYFVDSAREPGRVVPNYNKFWPQGQLRPVNGVEVEYVAGYGPKGQDVPAPIRQAILVWIGQLHSVSGIGEALKFEKVGDSSVSRFAPDETGSSIPLQSKNLLSTYRIWKV